MNETDFLVYYEIRCALKIVKDFKEKSNDDNKIINSLSHFEDSEAFKIIALRKEKRKYLKKIRDEFLNIRMKQICNVKCNVTTNKTYLKTLELIDECIFWFKTEKLSTKNLDIAYKKYSEDMMLYSKSHPSSR